MKSDDLAINSPAKSRNYRWIRFECLYYNAMWHADWYTVRDPRMKGLNSITYLGDSHMRVTGTALLKEDTSENAVLHCIRL